MKKSAFITGITGQDGAYLAELLLEKGYEVHGLIRRSSTDNLERIQPLLQRLHLHMGDLTDGEGLSRLMRQIAPDEVYNLGAQSHVGVSFDCPVYTAEVDAVGVLKLLEAVRNQRLIEKTKVYQASSSELFGEVREVPQTEQTPFYPRSPYAVAKQFAYWSIVNYREAYGMFACNGILFNHESPLRGATFVTRKITLGLVGIVKRKQEKLFLGNLNAKRDWGHAKDYVRMQWMILQQAKPDDYVIATGEQFSVRDFCQRAAAHLGITLEWQGSGVEEKGVIAALDRTSSFLEAHSLQVGQTVIEVSPQFFRPSEVETLLGSPKKAKELLGWEPEISFDQLVIEMVESDWKKR